MEYIVKYLGRWKLIPSKTKYESGDPPMSGLYEITKKEDLLSFKITWVDSIGNDQKSSYSEVCDGQYHECENKEFADEICLTLTSESLLESFARKDGKIVLRAKRELISDTEMKITMSGLKPNEGEYSNVSTYKKI